MEPLLPDGQERERYEETNSPLREISSSAASSPEVGNLLLLWALSELSDTTISGHSTDGDFTEPSSVSSEVVSLSDTEIDGELADLLNTETDNEAEARAKRSDHHPHLVHEDTTDESS